MASGSAPLMVLHGVPMKRRFPFLPFHRCPPVYSLRVPWGPVLPSAHRLGAFAMGAHPRVHRFPGRRLLCPLRLSPLASRMRETFPSPSFPPALDIQRGVSRVQDGRRKRNDGGGVLLALPRPRVAAPQSVDSGENRVPSVPFATVLRWTLVLPCTARLCFQARLADLSDKRGQGPPFPKGFPTLQVMHHVVPQPSATSRGLPAKGSEISLAPSPQNRT